jgi:hypothetical protein
LRGTIAVAIQLENGRQLSGKLHQLSVTGGLLELAGYIEERAWVGLTIPFASGTVHPTAEMMFPMRATIGYLQPFRFTRVREEEFHLLEREITGLLKQAVAGHGLGANPPRYFLESR